MTPELVIFDCDGVLVDTEHVTDLAISESLTGYGLPIQPDEVNHLFNGGTMQAVGEEAALRGAAIPDNWLDEIYETVFAELRKGVPVVEGVMDLIAHCDRHGIKRAIASNAPIAKMEITLPPSGLWDSFAGRIYSGHDHGPKPLPDMLLKIMRDAGASPDRTIMIDDMPAGFNAAKAANVRCFGYVALGDPARIGQTGAVPVTAMHQITSAIKAF